MLATNHKGLIEAAFKLLVPNSSGAKMTKTKPRDMVGTATHKKAERRAEIMACNRLNPDLDSSIDRDEMYIFG